MTSALASVAAECAQGSLAGTLNFPEVVARLSAAGVERYYVDYVRHEATYYTPTGESHIEGLKHPAAPLASEFSAAGVEAAIRASQRGEINYAEFLHRTLAAGCVGYFVQIAGRRALYFGRLGEVHIEPFPSAPSL
jgi:uncharacterized protein YbcV (DUF1398 family)